MQDSLLQTTDFKVLSSAFETLNKHLALRSYMTGYSLSLADLAVWGALQGIPVFKKNLKIQGKDVNLTRWFQHLASLETFQSAAADFEGPKTANKKVLLFRIAFHTCGYQDRHVKRTSFFFRSHTNPNVQSASTTEQKKDQGNFDIPLKDAEMGKVVTRFPPEPSGYLHIGHAKAALLNDHFARKYNGKLLLRFDDTNPSKEKMEFEESIKEDLLLLGIKADACSHTSDHFPKIYNYALQMITQGKAYVDDTDQETMRAERFDGIESKCRNLSVDENLKRFEDMRQGTEYVSFFKKIIKRPL